MHFHAFIDSALFFVAFFAGAVDTVAGGGGLLTLPALLMAGLPPATALGTNRLQSCIGEFTATLHFLFSKQLGFYLLMLCVIFALIGASIGTISVQHISADHLRRWLPVCLLVVLAYSLFSGDIFKIKKRWFLSARFFAPLFGLTIGFYNGFFGPGTGSFWIIAFFLFAGLPLRESSMHAKPVNLAGNMASFCWFFHSGNIAFFIALVMAAGQIFGSSLGARLVIHKGAKIIKPIFVAVVLLMIVELLIRELF